jgi:hypothetical protein
MGYVHFPGHQYSDFSAIYKEIQVGSFIGVENVVWTLSIKCQKKKGLWVCGCCPYLCVFFLMHKTGQKKTAWF